MESKKSCIISPRNFTSYNNQKIDIESKNNKINNTDIKAFILDGNYK